ncbi:RNA polymerase-associated protein RapA [Frankliniella fusca]|uniref:RNA polymerase-associated protein RapA n=1 Tax=Frankliniella fusca TaxID=407009 RepID=A0AAE1HM56_9NEOP|nr:RNA polymerase-associated protein RapA [Frankliniella fusca]
MPEPETLVSDFELSIINAVKTVFPHSNIRLCFFHLGQSVYRKVQESGLQVAYANPDDREIKNGVHMLLSLAFVPVEDLEIGHSTTCRKTWWRSWTPYEPADWNQYIAAQHGEQRTNNLCEAWHRRFNAVVGKAHPSFYSLLRDIKKEQATTGTLIVEIDLGRSVREPQRKKYKDVTDRLQRIVLRYEQYKNDDDVNGFPRHCGHQFTLINFLGERHFRQNWSK